MTKLRWLCRAVWFLNVLFLINQSIIHWPDIGWCIAVAWFGLYVVSCEKNNADIDLFFDTLEKLRETALTYNELSIKLAQENNRLREKVGENL